MCWCRALRNARCVIVRCSMSPMSGYAACYLEADLSHFLWHLLRRSCLTCCCTSCRRDNTLAQAVLEAVLQDRALVNASRPASVYLSFSSLLYRAKAAALLVLVAWSLPLSLMLSALVVLRHCWRLFASGQGEPLWQRVRDRLSGERRPNRGTALVSGEHDTLPLQRCSEHGHLKAMYMECADASVQLRGYGVLCGRGEEHQGVACVPPAAPRWLARHPCGHAQVRAPHPCRH